MMDLSDGLSTDLPRLCATSGVGARLHASRIPAIKEPNRPGAKNVYALDLALNGGDDYELLFTVRPSKARQVPHAFQGVPLTAIGEITRERILTLVRQDGQKRPLPRGGWDPFRRTARW
jgi:thiamine-monophosphate kinase